MYGTMKKICITENDYRRLKQLIRVVLERSRVSGGGVPEHLVQAEEALKQAVVMQPQVIPADIITINSTFSFTSLPAGGERTATLVFPRVAPPEFEAISVLSPLGLAVLGHAAGDLVRYEAPGGVQEVKIEKILSQPEAERKYDL